MCGGAMLSRSSAVSKRAAGSVRNRPKWVRIQVVRLGPRWPRRRFLRGGASAVSGACSMGGVGWDQRELQLAGRWGT
eukprot:12884558-Prorocentrum_lima.AAC.1